MATVNVGARAAITATVDTGSTFLPVALSLCQTNPANGQCINPAAPASSVTAQINANQTPTFAVVVRGAGNVPFLPGVNRAFVRSKTASGATVGATSVAATAPNLSRLYLGEAHLPRLARWPMMEPMITVRLVLVLVLLAAPLAAEAQQVRTVRRVGYLGDSSPSLESNLVEAFRRGLRERGYVEGQNIVIEYRWAEGTYDRFPLLVAELVRLKVDVIVIAGTPAALAAKQMTTTIPIVMAVTGDALEAGLVSSLARPGGNVTGLSTLMPELEGKRLELLKEVLPRLVRMAVLANPGNPFSAIDGKAIRIAAEALRVKLQTVEIRAPEEFDRAFAAITNAHPDALTIIGDRFLLTYRKRIVDFARQARLAGIYPYSEFVAEGGLMSYGPNYPAMFERSAIYVDKILKGAKPGDLPIEQPTTFELVINLKTAKALGLTIPPALLLRADQVIQ